MRRRIIPPRAASAAASRSAAAVVLRLPIEIDYLANPLLENERLLGVRKIDAFIALRFSQPGAQSRKTLPKNDPGWRPQITCGHFVTCRHNLRSEH